MVVPGIARAVSHANRSALVLWSVFGPLPAMARSAARFTAAAALLVGLISAGCSEQIVVTQLPLGGSCLSCHEGITDVHPFFALACVDCHGGNDRVTIPANVNVRDQALLQKSHVLPLDPAMWWANGIDDDADGFVDEQGEFFDGRVIQSEDSPFADGRRAKRNQMDSEMNRDLNYLRFINPGDLRVAQVSCGGRNNNSNPAMVCHAEVVYDMRRSMMSTNAGVAGGAAYGNAQVPVASMFGADFAQSPAGGRYDQRNPRIGRHGYTFNYDAIDSAWNSEFVDPGRNIVAGGFDHDALLDVARTNIDPQDDKFEATAGPLFDDGVTGSDAVYDPGPGLTRTGQPLQFFDPADLANNRAVEVLQNIGNAANRSWPPQGSATELRVQRIIEALGFPRQSPVENDFDFPNPNTPGDPITNPVDAALRSFRAYHPLNWWAPNDNFGFVDFTTSPNENDEPPQDPADVELRNSNNPFGRGRPSGCTACHIEYAKDGRNLEPTDRTVADNGKQPDLELPFGIRQDLGHRFYPKRHELKRTVNTETCGSCHGFVTRVDYAMQGLYEQETDLTNLEHVNTIGTFQYTTPKGSCVRMFDNLAHYRNGQIVNDGEGRSEDLNNNGELDTNLIEADLNGDDVLQPNEDFNKNGRLDEAPISEDANGNNCLDLPDRVERRESFDGRQSRIIYGGSNGSTRLLDVHFERGFHCTDCHIQNDVHGDSNIYTRNWDAVQIECDDCHGTNDAEAPLVFSGPNGGDDMTARHYNTAFGKPWFERQNGKIIQNSRVQGGLSWVVPQLTSPKDSASAYAHRQFPESFDPALDGEEFQRTYVHVAERSEKGGLECYACHSSWQPNCLSCHIKMDVTKPKQEIWWGDDDVEDTFFQLFSFTRSPFLLGHAGDVEKNKIAPHRSTMQVHVSIVADSVQIAESAMFSTQGSLSSMSSNPYYPHTVRTTETKSCARCHTLVDEADRIGNDHLITETTGQGTGRYQNIGDWAVVSSSAGMELLDVKKEAKGDVTFPGFDFFDGNADGQKRRKVLFNSGPASDVVVNRGVSFQDGNGDPYDLAIIASERGVSIVDFFGRDNVGYPPTELARLDTFGPVRSVDTVEAAASQSSRFILATDEEIAVLDYRSALDFAKTARLIDADAGNDPVNDQPLPDAGPDALRQGVALVGSLPHGKDAPTKVRLHGRFAVLAHAGGISVFELGLSDSLAEIDPGAPLSELVTFATQHPALDVTTHGRFAYVATGAGGVEIFDIGPVVMNTLFDGLSTAPAAMALVGDVTADSRGVAMWGSRLLVADGENGLRILDVSTPADPRLEQTLQNLGGAVALDNATAVVLAEVPTRTFAIVANGAQVHAINITPTVDFRRQLQAADVDPAGFRGLRLSHERSDPLTPYDPKNATRQVFTFPTDGNVTSIARGLAFDNIEDKGGRRLRDGWSIGAAPLNERMIARMRNVRVREAPGYKDIRGDGLGCVVREGDETRVSPDPENPDRCLPPQ